MSASRADTAVAAVRMEGVAMDYAIPKRYRDYLLHPFAPPKRSRALHDVDLVVDRHQRLAILGPNGAGKTTLLKLLGGLLYPALGRVSVLGMDTVECNLEVRGRVGYVINEERSFYWRLTGRQNLEFFGILDNLERDALRQRIDLLLELVGLVHAGDARVSDYSAGMKQRLAIARGLLNDPDILLLDEPTRSLDPTGTEDMRHFLASVVEGERPRTLVLTTNQLPEAAELCNTVVVISHGRIAARSSLGHDEVSALSAFYRESLEADA